MNLHEKTDQKKHPILTCHVQNQNPSDSDLDVFGFFYIFLEANNRKILN